MKKSADKLNFIKIKYFCPVKDNVKRMKGQATELEKVFAKDAFDKRLLYKILKETLQTQH